MPGRSRSGVVCVRAGSTRLEARRGGLALVGAGLLSTFLNLAFVAGWAATAPAGDDWRATPWPFAASSCLSALVAAAVWAGWSGLERRRKHPRLNPATTAVRLDRF